MAGRVITDADGVRELLRAIYDSYECAIDTETTGLYWALGQKAFLATFAPNETDAYLCADPKLVYEIMDHIAESGLFSMVFHNAVFDLHMIRAWNGWMPKKGYGSLKLEDTMHAFRIQYPGSSAKLKIASQRFCPDMDVIGPEKAVKEWIRDNSYFETVAGKRTLVTPGYDAVPMELMAPYAMQDVILTIRDHHGLARERALWQRPAYLAPEVPPPDEAYRAEIKLIGKVIVDLERKGMHVRKAALRSGLIESAEHIAELMTAWSKADFKILDKDGEEQACSPTSPVQLKKLFYDVAHEPLKHRTKPSKTWKDGGPSTGESALVDAVTPIGKRMSSILLPLRSWKKYSERLTEIDSFLASDGGVHTSLKSDKAKTGRFSSTEPALQNLTRPGLLKDGTLDPLKRYSHARAVFGPPPGFEWLIWDLSQIELRLAAHFMRDQEMIQAFIEGVDFHSLTASRMYGVPLAAVTKTMRAIAKILNFSILYGAGVRKITETLRYGAAGTEPLALEDVLHALVLLLPDTFKIEDDERLHYAEILREWVWEDGKDADTAYVNGKKMVLTGQYEWRDLNDEELFTLLGKTLYDAYHKENPKVSEFTTKASDRAKKYGGIYTAFGLFIPIPKPTWSAEHKRFLTYFHKAGNAVVQGSAAGLMKGLMVRDVEVCEEYALERNLQMWRDIALILSIHDESIHEVPVGHALPLARKMDRVLSHWPQFNVPIVLEYAFVPEGGNWAEKQKLEIA